MGWSSGSELMDKVINAAQYTIFDLRLRRMFYLEVIKAFEGHDWDTQDECLRKDPIFDTALKELHPDWEI